MFPENHPQPGPMPKDFLRELTGCRRCSRLVACRESVPAVRGRSKKDYWNRPVPGFGDADARICLVGLAPGAQGANRTGRPFTGDGAGDFMYPLLHAQGFASRPDVLSLDDGLQLSDLYITNAVKCVPPENKPTHGEFEQCLPYLEEELAALKKLRVVLVLGQGAWSSYLRLLKRRGEIERLSQHPFGHGAAFRTRPEGPWVLGSYHTSRYNVQTGRIDAPMFSALLDQACRLADEG